MLDKLFTPKWVRIEEHPEWFATIETKNSLNLLPEEALERTMGENQNQINDPTDQTISLPPVEIPEHLSNWFDVTAEVLDDISEETALGNLAAIGKMGAHDPEIIRNYVKNIPIETIRILEQQAVDQACEQSKQLSAHITGRHILDDRNLHDQQIKLKKLYHIANCLEVAGHKQLLNTLINLERVYNYALSTQAAKI